VNVIIVIEGHLLNRGYGADDAAKESKLIMLAMAYYLQGAMLYVPKARMMKTAQKREALWRAYKDHSKNGDKVDMNGLAIRFGMSLQHAYSIVREHRKAAQEGMKQGAKKGAPKTNGSTMPPSVHRRRSTAQKREALWIAYKDHSKNGDKVDMNALAIRFGMSLQGAYSSVREHRKAAQEGFNSEPPKPSASLEVVQ